MIYGLSISWFTFQPAVKFEPVCDEGDDEQELILPLLPDVSDLPADDVTDLPPKEEHQQNQSPQLLLQQPAQPWRFVSWCVHNLSCEIWKVAFHKGWRTS